MNPLWNALKTERWNPYVVGVGIGLISVGTFLSADKALGTSSSFVHLTGFVEALFAPGHVSGPDATAYFAKEINEKTPFFDWQFFLVIGVAIGAFVANRLSRGPHDATVPALWSWRFGPQAAVRSAGAFAFGAISLFGARLAGGCTSGHGISGGLQLALSSWTFFLAMFASGVVTAFLIFGREGRRHVLG